MVLLDFFFKNSLSKEGELFWELLCLWNLSIQFMNSGTVALSWGASGDMLLGPGAGVIDDRWPQWCSLKWE